MVCWHIKGQSYERCLWKAKRKKVKKIIVADAEPSIFSPTDWNSVLICKYNNSPTLKQQLKSHFFALALNPWTFYYTFVSRFCVVFFLQLEQKYHDHLERAS